MALWGLTALLLAGATSASPAGPTLSPCHVHGASGEVRCGELSVAEDPAHPEAKRIALHVAVVPALSGHPQPDPVFVLAGGPGQSAISLAGTVTGMLAKVHRTRDLVFVDQRGTGRSEPLACDDATDGGLADDFRDQPDRAGLQACLDRYHAAGDDPRLFLTPEAMDDLDAVRAALGYPRINLWGASYGTRAALAYLRQHGDRVRAAVLDGVDPPSESLLLTAADDAQRAFDLIFQACAQDADCHRTYPRVREDFEALLAHLAVTPAAVSLPDPRTGAPVHFTLTRSGFVRHLHGLLYVPEIASLLPLIIHRASEGDFAPFVAQAAAMEGSTESGLSMGMFLSVICAEDAPAATPAALAQQAGSLYLGDAFARSMLDACALWPRGALPADYHQLVRSSVPVLLLSGELDPVTPPRRAEEALAGLTQGTHLIVPGVGHGTSARGCVPDLVAAFLEAGSAARLDPACLRTLARPPFFVSFAGPTP